MDDEDFITKLMGDTYVNPLDLFILVGIVYFTLAVLGYTKMGV
jgi:hypothetical protein